MFFDFDTLYNEALGSAFTSGKKRYYDNRVKNVVTGQQNGKYVIDATVEGDDTYHTRIIFDEQGGLYDYQCDCHDFNLANGPCKHIVATALSFEELNPTINTQGVQARKTDAPAINLISEYNKRKHRKLMTSDSVKVEIIPYLSLTDGVSLRFTLGHKKQYNLKDISDFVSAFSSSGYRRYGVDLELYHIYDNFTPKSQKIINFITQCYLEKVDFSNNFMKYKDEIRLMHSDIDEFFSLFEGSLIHYEKSELVLVAPFNTTLPAKMMITQEEDGYSVGLNMNEVKFICGKEWQYALVSNRIYRVSHKYVDAVTAFFNTIEFKKKLYVAESDMSLFYNSVISQLNNYIDIEAEGIDLSVYEAAPFIAKLFINSVDGVVQADLECSYDDVKFDLFSDNISGDFVRDWESETGLKELLQKYFRHYPALYIDDEEDIFIFLSEGVKELFNFAEVFIMDTMKKLKIRTSPRIHVGVKLSGDLLNLELSGEGYTVDELIAILNAYKEHKRYIRLGGGFVGLEDNSIDALSEILDVAKVTETGFEMPGYYAPFVNNELKNGFFSLDRDSSFKALIKGLDSVENADFPVPDELKDVLRNYQKTGYRWLKMLKDNNFGGILADDMGLGKSLQVIALLLEKPCKALIVCPTTLMLNWVNEFNKFAPSVKVLVVMGSIEERKAKLDSMQDYDVVITSYDLIRRDEESYENIIFDYAIVDEAQFIKNPETKNARAVKKIRAKHRFALTGTPIENNLGELWSIFDFIMPRYLGSYSSFKDKYEIDIVRGDEDATAKLQRLVKPFILRRLKANVLKELPAKMESNISASLEGEQQKLYNANLSLIKESVMSDNNVNKVVILSMLTKLRQICCEPSLVYPDYTGNSAKLETCIQLIQQAVDGHHKVLLFSQFTSMLDIIRRKLMEIGVSHYILKGDTPKTERIRLVNKFNQDDTNVFLISLKAGGTGLNLTGADVVIHYDPWWNESVMNQATDRAYRMGQTKSVQVYKLILKNTIEEKIVELQEKKTALSSLVVGGANNIKEIINIIKQS